MNLYKLTQDQVAGYDTFDSCVVAAESEQDAKLIPPRAWAEKGDLSSATWANSTEAISCEYLGTAKDGTPEGVICSSFNAG